VDFPGTFMIAGGVGSILVAVSMSTSWGWAGTPTTVLYVVSAVLLAGFILYSIRAADPIVDLRIFASKPILLAAVVSSAAYSVTGIFATMAALIALTPHLPGTDYGLGLSAFSYSVITAPQAVVTLIGGAVVGLWIRKRGATGFAVVGLVLLAVGTVLIALYNASVPQAVGAALIEALGMGLTYACMPNLVIAGTPQDKQGSQASMIQVFASGFSAIVPVVLFVILAREGHLVGTFFAYSEAGFRAGSYLAAGICAVVAVAALTVLRPRKGEVLGVLNQEKGQPSEEAAAAR
jgi:MFS family permease